MSTQKTLLARLFIRFDRAFDLIVQGLHAVHQGIWLGFLDRDALQAIAGIQYDERWQRYQSDDHNLNGFFDWEKPVIDEYFADCHHVLVGAAGGGREVIALAKKGIDVTGFECQPNLVATAETLVKAQGLKATFIQAEPDVVPEGLGEFDGLILGWGAYIHIVGKATRIRFLKQFRDHAEPGAPLLMSFFERKADSRKMRLTRFIANTIRRLRRADERIEMGDSLYGTFDHYFTRQEIEAEMQAAGFELERYDAGNFPYAIGRAV